MQRYKWNIWLVTWGFIGSFQLTNSPDIDSDLSTHMFFAYKFIDNPWIRHQLSMHYRHQTMENRVYYMYLFKWILSLQVTYRILTRYTWWYRGPWPHHNSTIKNGKNIDLSGGYSDSHLMEALKIPAGRIMSVSKWILTASSTSLDKILS